MNSYVLIDNDGPCMALTFEFSWRLLSRNIILLLSHSVSFWCAVTKCALETIWSDWRVLRGGYFRKIGISERCVFSPVFVDVWSLQSITLIREKHFLWSSSLREGSDWRLAGYWLRSSLLEEVVFTEVVSSWGLGLERFSFSSEYVNIKLTQLFNKLQSQ